MSCPPWCCFEPTGFAHEGEELRVCSLPVDYRAHHGPVRDRRASDTIAWCSVTASSGGDEEPGDVGVAEAHPRISPDAEVSPHLPVAVERPATTHEEVSDAQRQPRRHPRPVREHRYAGPPAPTSTTPSRSRARAQRRYEAKKRAFMARHPWEAVHGSVDVDGARARSRSVPVG